MLTFEELQKQVKEMGIQSKGEYQEKAKELNWTLNPDKSLNGWSNWYDFLGKKQVTKKPLPTLSELREAVKNYKFVTVDEYVEESKNHEDWVSHPEKTYSEEWTNWGELLGVKKLSFSELKEEIKSYNLKTKDDYKKESSNHSDWYSNPNQKFKEWIDWKDFLGN